MILRHHVRIPAPPEAVWAVLCHVESWPDWTPTVAAARALDGSDPAPGRRFALKQPLQRERVWTVTEAGPDHAFRWRTMGRSGFEAGHRVVPDGQGGSVAHADLIPLGRMRAVWPLLRPVLHRALSAEAEGLRSAFPRRA